MPNIKIQKLSFFTLALSLDPNSNGRLEFQFQKPKNEKEHLTINRNMKASLQEKSKDWEGKESH